MTNKININAIKARLNDKAVESRLDKIELGKAIAEKAIAAFNATDNFVEHYDAIEITAYIEAPELEKFVRNDHRIGAQNLRDKLSDPMVREICNVVADALDDPVNFNLFVWSKDGKIGLATYFDK